MTDANLLTVWYDDIDGVRVFFCPDVLPPPKLTGEPTYIDADHVEIDGQRYRIVPKPTEGL